MIVNIEKMIPDITDLLKNTDFDTKPKQILKIIRRKQYALQ